MRKITTDDLKNWWTTYVRPDTSVLYVAGDITPEQGFDLAQAVPRRLAGRTVRARTRRRRRSPTRRPTSIFLVNKPGLVQSEIRVAQIGVTRDDPEYQPRACSRRSSAAASAAG